MGKVKPITILHLSDMQFGKNHRFGVAVTPEGDNPYNTLRERLILDLRMLREDHRLVPDLMILTGDLTEWGMKPEFDDVLGLIMGLEKELSLTRERLIVIPGNHDINRKACEAYFNECEADTIQPAKPYWAKWKHYVRFFGELYGDVPQKREFTKAQPWTLFEIEQLKIVVAGLNSTIAESHCDEDHYGWVGEPQLRWFAEKLESYGQDKWLRIGAVHHNVVRGAKDDENLRDADDLKKILRTHLNAVLHGHTHEADMSFWIDQNVPTLSTGSAAVTREARPDEVPNQYQIIQFWPEHMIRYSRAYDPRGKEWIPDARITEGEVAGRQIQQIKFQSVHAAFPPICVLPAESLPPEPRMNLDNELDAFTQIVTGADTQTRLLLVTGDGGMGKSYLLRLYQRVADDNSLPLIFFDLREQISVEKCFHQIINGFGYDHFPCCDAFLTDKPHQPFLPSQEESWQRSLTRYFFTDMRRYTAPPRPAVILFDQYESADSMLKEWLHKLFLPRLSAHHIIVVIAGREPFYPPPSSQGSRHFPLTGVTVDWYQKYVDAYNIPLDPRHTVLLHEALKGQPKLFIEFVKNRYRTLSQYA